MTVMDRSLVNVSVSGSSGASDGQVSDRGASDGQVSG